MVSTSPGPDSVRRPDTPVNIVVSKGEAIDIPDLIGDDPSDARSELRDAGFKVKFAERGVFSDEDKGTIAEQSPGEGTEGAKGDTVTLTLSKGRQMIEVPDVTGDNIDDAKQQLEDLGFTVNVDKPLLFPGDTVKDQSVSGGDKAPKGSEITITVKGGVF